MLRNALFDSKFKVVTGYKATPTSTSPWSAARCTARWANWSTLKALNGNWLEEKKINDPAQWALQKHPELPERAADLELAKTPEQKQALELALARLEFGRPFFMPPGVPADRVARASAAPSTPP